MTNAVIITGSNGGIGQALANEFKLAGYFTIGIDKEASEIADINIRIDLAHLVSNKTTRKELADEFDNALENKNLKGLINNAALQILDRFDDLTIDDFRKTMDTNLTVPFILSKLLFPRLKRSKGSIVNIGSIHAQLTKPNFVAYATSKAALQGLTQAMAVDSGDQVRVNNIQAAAINTKMLIDGFTDKPNGYERLNSFHPTGKIGEPAEVAKLALFLLSDAANFINGATLPIDGGISHRLHDPE